MHCASPLPICEPPRLPLFPTTTAPSHTATTTASCLRRLPILVRNRRPDLKTCLPCRAPQAQCPNSRPPLHAPTRSALERTDIAILASLRAPHTPAPTRATGSMLELPNVTPRAAEIGAGENRHRRLDHPPRAAHSRTSVHQRR
jgi:hypothetical protein